MPRTNRSRNLDQNRWLNFGHENTAKRILRLTNANYLSKMTRDIVSELDMPMGWPDRDNIDVIGMGMGKMEYESWKAMKSQSDESKSALLVFLRTLK